MVGVRTATGRIDTVRCRRRRSRRRDPVPRAGSPPGCSRLSRPR